MFPKPDGRLALATARALLVVSTLFLLWPGSVEAKPATPKKQ